MRNGATHDRACGARRDGGGGGWFFARVALCCGIALSGTARADDAYACPGGNFGRTGVYPGKGPETMPDGWKVLVKEPYISRIYSFIVFGGKILSVNNKSLVATNFQGERKWEANITFPGSRSQSTAIRMHQVLGWRDKVIVVSLNGSVKAFALDDGRLLWSRTGGELNMDGMPAGQFPSETHTPPPVVYKDCLHFAGERNIQRLSMEDGKELKPFEFLDNEIRKVIFTSPLAVSDSKLFFCAKTKKGEASACYAIDLESGKLSWKQERGPFNDQILVKDRNIILVGQYVSGTEAWERKRFSKPVASYDHETGIELPMKDLFTYGTGEVLHQGALFNSSNRELAKVDILKGKTLWKYRSKYKEQLFPAMAMGGGVIYTREGSGLTQRLHAIHESNGSPLWIYEIPATERVELMIPSNDALFCLAAEGVVVLGTPVETQPVSGKDGGIPSDPATIRKEIEDIDRQLGELREEWDESKRLLGEATVEATEQREAASRRVREIGEAVPKLKARRAELEKLLK